MWLCPYNCSWNGQNGDAEDGKSKKLQYEGPDPELAAMLERDVLETNTWMQLAGGGLGSKIDMP